MQLNIYRFSYFGFLSERQKSASRYGLVLVIFFISFASSLGQDQNVAEKKVFSIDEILNVYTKSPGELAFKDNLAFLKNAKGLPVIEGLEFRTETDEYAIENQQYQLRVKFNSKNERKAYQRMLATQVSLFDKMQSEEINDRIESVYSSVVELYFLEQEFDLIGSQLLNVYDRRTVLEKLLLQNSEDYIKDWLSNEEAILELKTDSTTIAHDIDIRTTMLLGSGDASIDYGDWISVAQIEKKSTGILDTLGQEILLEDIEERYILEELALEEAERKKILEFAQIQYQQDRKLSFQNEISLSTGLNIPLKTSNQLKTNDLKIEYLEKKQKNDIRKVENSNDKRELKLKMASKVAEYYQLVEMVKNQRLEETLQDFSTNANVSPMTLLDVQKSITKNSFKILKHRKEIFEIYLEIIKKAGSINKNAKTNHLNNSIH